MQDILEHLADLTTAERADAAAEKLPQVGQNYLAAHVEADLPVARPGEVLKVGKANLLEVAQTTKTPAQDDGPDTFEGA